MSPEFISGHVLVLLVSGGVMFKFLIGLMYLGSLLFSNCVLEGVIRS